VQAAPLTGFGVTQQCADALSIEAPLGRLAEILGLDLGYAGAKQFDLRLERVAEVAKIAFVLVAARLRTVCFGHDPHLLSAIGL
jgi:hypothetical protein